MIRVTVPATSANLGSGFDTLGLAFTMYNRIEVEPWAHLKIEIDNHQGGVLPMGSSNLVWRSIVRTFEAAGRTAPSLRIQQENGIPVTRGLGSSAACVVGGVEAANALMGGILSLHERIDLATQIDGHPDNVTPTLLGGLVTACVEDSKVLYVRTMPHDLFRFCALIPDYHLPTVKARAVLPAQYSRADTVHSIGRASLMFASLREGCAENIKAACQDRMHQPYRKALIPGYDALVAGVERIGAAGVYLSGAGPTMVMIATRDTQAACEVGLPAILSALPGTWTASWLDVCETGTLVETISV